MRFRPTLFLFAFAGPLVPLSARADDPPPAPAPPPSTQLAIDVDERAAEIFVDGRSVGKAPLAAPVPLSPGKHAVEARGENATKELREVVVAQGESASIVLRLHPFRDDVIGYDLYKTTPAPVPKDNARWDAIAVLGGTASIVALGVGIGFNIAANHAASSAVADQRAIFAASTGGSPCAHPSANVASTCTTLASELASRDRSANLAIGGYALAGAAAIATAAYIFWPRMMEGAHVSPVVFGMNGGGASLGGSF